MATHCDIMINWATTRPSTFTTTLLDCARRRDLQVMIVTPGETARARQRLSRKSLTVDVFLNTQADGSDMDCPRMRLCRTAKAAGALVIEDPDDAHIYADRALQLEYLQRAGLTVPRHVVIDPWHPRKARLSDSQQAVLGTAWRARPAIGLDANGTLDGLGRCTIGSLSRGKFATGQKLLIERQPAARRVRPLYRVWYLFGNIYACRVEDDLALTPCQQPLDGLAGVLTRMHAVTGLDWFVTEVARSAVGADARWAICEPANALAGLGPGARMLSGLPPWIAGEAARVLVDVAWHRHHGRTVPAGTTLRMAPR